MTGADKVVCQAATLLLLFVLTLTPAKAQFLGGGGGGQDMMTQMAPMLNMMKAKMGKRRFATTMQTMGPMMSGMMDGGGFGGMMGGGGMPGLGGGISGGFGGGGASTFGGGVPSAAESYGAGLGGFGGGGELMGMIPQIMRMANVGGGGRHGRRHRRR